MSARATDTEVSMGSVSRYLRQNVVGFAALFVALHAGAYAAITTNSDLATG
jgi:hypothetical protein